MFEEIQEEEPATLTGVETTTNIYSKLRLRDGDNLTAGKPGDTGYFIVREPDLTNEDIGSENILGFENTKAMADNLVQEYKNMINSIKKYNGFYIGRYELTGTVESPKEKSGEVLTNINWYNAYKACQNVIKNNADVKSTMIYGCQWDETMSWLSQKGYNTDSNSSSWGNYDGSSLNTGSSSRYKANEIFDLAGNYSEWTQTANAEAFRIVRGGNYTEYVYASIYSGYKPQGEGSCSTTRPTLCIK